MSDPVPASELVATLRRVSGGTAVVALVRAAADRIEEQDQSIHLNAQTFAALEAELRAKLAAERALADMLAEGIEAKNALLAQYRVGGGRQPSEALFRRLANADAALAAHRERRKP
jgi:uncharacterized protein (DUF1501 family)